MIISVSLFRSKQLPPPRAACVSLSRRAGRLERSGSNFAKMSHTFRSRDYLMVAPALMYALYNNLTFNNLKAFDPNVFQVLSMIARARAKLP